MSLRVALFALGMLLSAAGSAQWSVVYLHPTGMTYSVAYGNYGNAQVGIADNGNTSRAARWLGTPDTYVSLHPILASQSIALATNGQRQGGFATISGDDHASIWEGSAASWIDLHPSEFRRSRILSMQGEQAVGYGRRPDSTYRAILWNGTSPVFTNLHTSGDVHSQALSTDGDRQVGYVNDSELRYRAYIWNDTAQSRVSLHPYPWGHSVATDIDGSSQGGYVWADTGFGQEHACVWHDTPASFVDLHPNTAIWSRVNSVFGQYQVGTASIGTVKHAALWTGTKASFVDLHAMVQNDFSETTAESVHVNNGNVYVVGQGIRNGASNQAIMWVFSGPADVSPTSFSVVNGSLSGGTAADLVNSDDQRVAIDKTVGSSASPEVQVIVDGISPFFLTGGITIQVESHATQPGANQTIEAYNFAAQTWVSFETAAVPTADNVRVVNIMQSPGSFIQPDTGKVRVRLSYAQTTRSIRGWGARIDQVKWTIN
jgi:hypothetical protein